MRRAWPIGLALASIACGAGPPTSVFTPVAQPVARFSIGGDIRSVLGNDGVALATVVLSQTAPLTAMSDAQGNFRVDDVPAGPVFVSITAPGYLNYRTKLNVSASREDVSWTLIPDAPPFSLGFYRQFARGGFEGPHQPLRPRTIAPSFYFIDRTVDRGEPVPDALMAAIRANFRRAVPELSAGRFQVAGFDRGPTRLALPRGWVTVEFFSEEFAGRFAGYATIGGDSGVIRLRLEPEWDASRDFLNCGWAALNVADHEIVHTMGYWHTDATYDDFHSGEGCPGSGRRERVQVHAAVMYSRAPGNVDVDQDGEMAASQTTSTAQPPFALCGQDVILRSRAGR